MGRQSKKRIDENDFRPMYRIAKNDTLTLILSKLGIEDVVNPQARDAMV